MAPAAPYHITMKPVAVTELEPKLLGAPGAATKVVTLSDDDGVDPPAFTAVTITAYAVFTVNPVNVADDPVDEAGVVVVPFNV